MKLNVVIVICLFVFAGVSACKKENNKSKIPVITLKSVTDEVKAGSSEDTVKIGFEFEDGDADIVTDDTTINLFISNSRDSDRFDYPLPYVGDEFKDPAVGFKGYCLVKIPAAFLLIRDTAVAKDSVRFTLTLEDGAGNMSNEITTPYVDLLK